MKNTSNYSRLGFQPATDFSQPWVLAVTPMRLASTRIPEKMLQKIGKQTLAEWSVQRLLHAFQTHPQVHVCAAVDDARLEKTLKQSFPGLSILITDPSIPTGTDRVSIASQDMLKSLVPESLLQNRKNLTGILNIQGDMPFMGTGGLQKIAEYFLQTPSEILQQFPMATLAGDWPTGEKYDSPGSVKVITNRQGAAIYFSRLPIPYGRQKLPKGKASEPPLGLLHYGVYGYTPSVLAQFCAHAPTELEVAEGLEQLRAQYLGIPILVIPIEGDSRSSFRGIDLPGDLKWAKMNYKKFQLTGKGKAK